MSTHAKGGGTGPPCVNFVNETNKSHHHVDPHSVDELLDDLPLEDVEGDGALEVVTGVEEDGVFRLESSLSFRLVGHSREAPIAGGVGPTAGAPAPGHLVKPGVHVVRVKDDEAEGMIRHDESEDGERGEGRRRHEDSVTETD